MDNLKLFLRNFSGQAMGFWTSLSAAKKVTIGAVLALVIMGVVALLATRETDPYEYLFVELSPEDQQAIAAHLQRIGKTDFIMDQHGIKVPRDNVMALRVALSQEGLPTQGQVGWEKFDTQDFARTEFEQNINRLRAIQGELARTIMSIEGIISARVHIVNPKQSLFVEDKKDPTAAVYIRTKRGVTLDERQIKGIVHLVSRSVESLSPDNVTIIDGEGKMLTKIEADDFASKMTKEMLAYKQQVEREMEEKIRQIVGRIVGPERVVAKVTANVDFTQEEKTISDIDPERYAVVSKHTQGAQMQGNGLNPTGIPGAKSNVPSETEAAAGGGGGPSASNKQDSELINYEVAKTVSRMTLPVGTIKRLTAAVLVDGKQLAALDGSSSPFVPRTEEEMKKIDELVKKAIGFQDKRDEVQVHNMQFQLDPVQMQQIADQKKESRDYVSTLAVSGATAVALLLFVAFVARPYFRWLSYDPERKQQQQIIEEFKPDLEISGIQNIQVKEEVPFEKLSPQEQVMFLAKNDPKRTTEALRMLLNPHQSTGA